MTEHDLQDILRDLLDELIDALTEADDDHPLYEYAERLQGIDDVGTYDEFGVLTRNAGLVLNLGDDTEFQITIVRR